MNDSVNTGVSVNITLNYDGTVYRLPTGSLPSQEVSSNVFCYTKRRTTVKGYVVPIMVPPKTSPPGPFSATFLAVFGPPGRSSAEWSLPNHVPLDR